MKFPRMEQLSQGALGIAPEAESRATGALATQTAVPRAEALRRVVEAWDFPVHSLGWLRWQISQGDPADGDAALALIARQCASGPRLSQEPPALMAVKMAQLIHDPGTRTAVTGGLLRTWCEDDPAQAAECWSQLPPDIAVGPWRTLLPPTP